MQSRDTPLHWIPSTGSAAAVRLLLDRGADVNAQNSVSVYSIALYSNFVLCVMSSTT